jgi:signal transduction histidine kinase
MRSSLYRRIAGGYIVVIAFVLAIQAVALLWLVGRPAASPDPEAIFGLAADLSQALETDPALNVPQRFARLRTDLAIFVILQDGTLASRRKAPPDAIVRTVTEQFERGPIDSGTLRSWFRSQYIGVPVRRGGDVVGVLGVVPLTPLEQFGSTIAALGLALVIVGALVSSLLIVGPIRSRIRNLSDAAVRLRSGDLSARAQEAGHDEVTELAHTFNSMADELERRAEALVASDRARRQLIADVSHELMTPLTAILGHLETLTMSEVRLDDERRGKQVAIATREAKRLERLIGDLLDLARLEAGGGDLEPEPIDAAELFEQVTAHHEHECRARRIRFSRSIAPAAKTIVADAFRLEQALVNVTANAIRHTGDGGEIRLDADRHGDSIVLTIADSGEGIAPEHLPHIFDRFYKTESTRGIASRGSGLGLSIVKAVVQRHGGHVSASSTVGVGTTIRIELPAGVQPRIGRAPAA